ncbi:uncharacterized protein PRCAT00000677001 [Priceomyces carsonii]|uniref:uncharacterized protein n=1 Tax=Priceomyces carsonii TaxID=28549 RepID=UPI002ED96E0C|nr:unnamed protein product [Priceomyces carsonii]
MDSIESFRPSESPEYDPSTLSNYKYFKVLETDLKLNILFDKKIVEGKVHYELEYLKSTKNIDLDISHLKVISTSVDGSKVDFEVINSNHELGSILRIKYADETGSKVSLSIEFETTSKCTALQFLEKEATDGKKSPYLFSQCANIHARSLFPCFDTPSVKSPYKMSARSPYFTLMSGLPAGIKDGVYTFNQPICIPSYVVAIASGDIVKAPIGPRSHVYCEPLMIEACKREFEHDMENFIKIAEALIFTYPWDQYDVLVLPMSFPYGGMENPNMTFATPTLISGDRQNVDVIAHELAHSWSGNLATNCSWEHLWLNEGWTVYLERRITGRLHGNAARDFSAIIGWNDLQNAIKGMKNADRYSPLVVNLKDRCSPDDAFSVVPYEKGFTLLYHIEQTLGGTEVFDPFIPHYFKRFKNKSLDTYQFLDLLYEFFSDKKKELDSIDWKAWIFNPGMPPVKPNFDTSLADQCYSLADKWYKEITENNDDYKKYFDKKDITCFSANQSVVFLDSLISFEKIGTFTWKSHKSALEALNEIYTDYSKSSNCEVLSRWLILQVTGENQHFYKRLGEFLGTVGRMKFVRPGYVLLNKVDHELAIHYFKQFESRYHPICRSMVKKDLNLI